MTTKELSDASTKLSDLVITNEKLQTYLGHGITKLWLCPEGEFGRIPWNAVAIINGATKQAIAEVDSPREFAFLRGQPSQTASNRDLEDRDKTMLLCGLSDFGRDIPALPGAMKEVSQLKALADELHRSVDYLPEEKA